MSEARGRTVSGAVRAGWYWLLVPVAGIAILAAVRGVTRDEPAASIEGPVEEHALRPSASPTPADRTPEAPGGDAKETVAAGLRYRFQPGRELVYRSAMETSVGMTYQGSETPPVRLAIEGTLRLRIHEVSRQGVDVSILLESPTVRGEAGGEDPGPATDLERQFSREVFASLDPCGRVLAWYFPAELAATARNMMGAFLLPGFLALPEEGDGSPYAREESDLLGPCLATYRAESAGEGRWVVTRSRRYTGLFFGEESLPVEPENGLYVATEGELAGTFDGAMGAFVSVAGRESLRVRGSVWDMAVAIDANQDYSLEFVEDRKFAPGPPGSFRRRLAAESALRFTELRPVGMEEGIHAKRQFPGESLEEVLTRVRTAVDAGNWGDEGPFLLLDLEALFLGEPESAVRAIEALRRGSLSEDETRTVAMALAGSVDPETQRALVEIALETSSTESSRAAALQSLSFVRHAQPGTVEALRELALTGEPASRALAIQGLGLIGSSYGGPQGSREAASSLLELEPSDPETLHTWLLAMGNAAPVGGDERVLPHAGQLDDTLRAAAVYALRRYSSRGARAAVARAAEGDPSPEVRAEAVRALAVAPGQAPIAALRRVLERDAESGLRLEAVRALALRRRASSQAAEALRLAVGDPDPDVRDAAREALSREG